MEQDHGVGREVKRLRENQRWSQSRLAVEAKMSVSGVSMIENGHRNLSTATLGKLAEAFGVDVGDLFPKGQARLPDFEETEQPRADADEVALDAARLQAMQDGQATNRLVASEGRPQTWFAHHENAAMVELLKYSPSELAPAMFELARRVVELESVQAVETKRSVEAEKTRSGSA